MTKIPIEISARHVHVDAATWRILFSTEAPRPARPISQPSQFVAVERVTLRGPGGAIENVGVVGPVRPVTQVELSRTDARRLGIEPPLRDSGNLAGASAITIIGADGEVTRPAAIIQQRHLHLSPVEADDLGLAVGSEISVDVPGPRGGRLNHVVVRIDPKYKLSLHLDTDEGNALGVTTGTYATLAG